MTCGEVAIDPPPFRRRASGRAYRSTRDAAPNLLAINGGASHLAGLPTHRSTDIEARKEGTGPEVGLAAAPRGAPEAMMWTQLVQAERDPHPFQPRKLLQLPVDGGAVEA